jgi:tetratricopeptide (TPR) repeat protein
LPLALDQAGAFIEQTASTPTEYLELFRTDAAALLADGADVGEAPGRSVVATFIPAFRRLEQEDRAAGDLLRLCAFLGPDGIPEEILASACPGEPLGDALGNPLERLRVMRSALRYSLLERDPETRTINVHRLVQAVLIAELHGAEYETWARRAGMAAAGAFPIPDFANWPLCERLMPHALTCAGHLREANVEMPELGRLLNLVGTYLRQRGRQAEAEPIQERALDIVQRTSDEDDIQLAWCLHNLSVLHHDANRLDHAEALARRALDTAERLLDPLDPRLTWFMAHLARVHRSRGQHGSAEALLKRSIEIGRVTDSPDDGQIAWPLQGLADLYLETGRFGEAEVLLTEGLARRRHVLGATHPHVAWTMASLAQAYAGNGRYDQAEELFSDALAVAQEALGQDHGIVAAIQARHRRALIGAGRRGTPRERREPAS